MTKSCERLALRVVADAGFRRNGQLWVSRVAQVAIALASQIWGSIISGFRGSYAADASAGVAQLAEHNVANVVVVGSNPITRSFSFSWRACQQAPFDGRNGAFS
jgi:hypothetical protein